MPLRSAPYRAPFLRIAKRIRQARAGATAATAQRRQPSVAHEVCGNGRGSGGNDEGGGVRSERKLSKNRVIIGLWGYISDATNRSNLGFVTRNYCVVIRKIKGIILIHRIIHSISRTPSGMDNNIFKTRYFNQFIV